MEKSGNMVWTDHIISNFLKAVFCRRSGVFLVKFEHNSHVVLVFFIGNFGDVITGWEMFLVN